VSEAPGLRRRSQGPFLSAASGRIRGAADHPEITPTVRGGAAAPLSSCSAERSAESPRWCR